MDKLKHEAIVKQLTIIRLHLEAHLCVKKSQAFVNIFDFVNAHFSCVGFAQLFAGDDFQQFHEIFSVRQVRKKIINLENVKHGKH